MNSFGTTTEQFALVDPRSVCESRRQYRRDSFRELDLANSYYATSGRWPDAGWILLDRRSYDQLDPYSNQLQLVIGDFVTDPVTITGLSVVQARCVTRGLASDPNAIYLLQLTNNVGVLYNQWFQYPVNAQYNVRAPSYSAVNENYYSGSLTGVNNTSAWTWDGMVGDLWSRASSLLGTYPGLPTVPDGAPEGWVFAGAPLWDAISELMDYLGFVVAGNVPTTPTIAVLGAADASYAALVAKYGDPTSVNFRMEDSMEYIDVGSGRVPSQVVVYFHRRNQYYGTEEAVRYDIPQWQNSPAYAVTVAAPAVFAAAVGTGYLWSAFTVRYDQEGNPILQDVLKAQTLAQELVASYFNVAYRGRAGCARAIYGGVLPFTTGSLVDGVRWFNTGKLGMDSDRYCGWRTEVVRGCGWPEIVSQFILRGATELV